MDKILTARKAILAELKRRALEHKPQDNYYSGAGEMPCPVCGTGKLRYSRSGYNGHVHARCSNDGCVAWME
jgi:hypothetical protein